MQVLKTNAEEYKHLCEVFDLMNKYGISFEVVYDEILVSFNHCISDKTKNMRLLDKEDNRPIMELPANFDFKLAVRNY